MMETTTTARVPDPIERGEARAEQWADRFEGDLYTCSCGRTCAVALVEALSADPYADPYAELFCPTCVKKAFVREGQKIPDIYTGQSSDLTEGRVGATGRAIDLNATLGELLDDRITGEVREIDNDNDDSETG